MTLSVIEYIGDGSTNIFSLPFEYLNRNDIKVFVDGAEVTFTYNDQSTIALDSTPSSGSFIVVERVTKRDTRVVDFQDDSTITETDLNNSDRQNFFLAQEALEQAGLALQADRQDRAWDAKERRIKNVQAPVNTQDAAHKGYVDGEVASLLSYTDATRESRVAQALNPNPLPNGPFDARGRRISNAAPGTTPADLATVGQLAQVSATGTANALWVPSGTGAVPRTVDAKLKEVVSVADYGADLTGTTDSRPAVQAAVDANPGKRIVFPDGVVRIDSRVVITSNDTVLDLGNCRIDATQFTGWTISAGSEWDSGRFRAPFEFRGTLKTSTTIASDVLANAATVTVADATGLAVGDLIDIESDGELWYTEGANTWYKRETNEITAISGDVLTLAYRTKFAYDATTHTVTVIPYTPIKNSHLIGGRAFGGGVRGNILNGEGPCFAAFEGFRDCSAKPRYVEGFQNTQVHFHYGIGAIFDGDTLRGHAENYSTAIVENQNSGFYGVWFNRGRDGLFRCARAYRLRHVQDGARWDGLRVEMLTAPQGGHRQPYGAHGGSDNFTFERCHYDGSDTALLWRGFNVEVAGCRWRCLGAQKNGFNDAVGTNSDLPRRYVFRDNDIRATRYALLIDCNQISSLHVVGAQRLENVTDTSYAPLYVERARIAYGVIGKGTEFIGVSADGVRFSADALIDGNVIVLDGAIVRGYTATGARLYTTQTGVILHVGDNVFAPNGGSNPILYASGTIRRMGVTALADGSSDFNSGSNANGSWVRYPDGTMICFRRIAGASTTTTAYDWPQPFLTGNTPVVSFAFERGAAGDFADIALRANSVTGFSIQSSAFPSGHSVHVTAIGRWRA